MSQRKDSGQSAVGVIVALVVFVLLAVGIYLGAWWLTKDSTDRQNRINERSYGRQSALVQTVLDDIREAQDPDLPPQQRAAIVSQICDAAGRLTGTLNLPLNAQAFISQECQ